MSVQVEKLLVSRAELIEKLTASDFSRRFGQTIGEIPPQRWSDNRGEAEYPAHEPLILTAFRGRENITNHGEGIGHHDAGTDSLNSPEDDDLGHGITQTTE